MFPNKPALYDSHFGMFVFSFIWHLSVCLGEGERECKCSSRTVLALVLALVKEKTQEGMRGMNLNSWSRSGRLAQWAGGQPGPGIYAGAARGMSSHDGDALPWCVGKTWARTPCTHIPILKEYWENIRNYFSVSLGDGGGRSQVGAHHSEIVAQFVDEVRNQQGPITAGMRG